MYYGTKTSSFSLVLSRHSLNTSLMRVDAVKTSDVTTVTLPQEMRKLIQSFTVTLQSKVDTHTQNAQTRYKCGCERRVSEAPSFIVGQNVFFEKPPLAATLEIAVDALSECSYSKLQQRSTKLFRFKDFQQYTVTIGEHTIRNRPSSTRTGRYSTRQYRAM